MSKSLSPALVAELVGTFALVFIGAGAGAIGAGGLVGVALAHGLLVLGLIYTFGHISGTHINPAVTTALWIARIIETRRAAAYILVQLVGGIAAAFCLRGVLSGTEWNANGLGATVLADGVSPLTGVILEAILTFFLVNAVLNAAVSGMAGQQAGIAIGLTLTSLILMGGPLTGAGLNPARTLGPALASSHLTNLWVYFVGPVAGATIGALLYRGVFANRR